jgi:hypothetical protein
MRLTKTLLSIAISTAIMVPLSQAETIGTLKNVETSSAIIIDGIVDESWSEAPALEVTLDKTPYQPSNGYVGVTNSTVTLKSLRSGADIYFLVQWTDSTQSLDRFPWMKQSDGSWEQLSNKDDTGHDNTYYEDKMAFLWNINYKTFEKKGCGAACHMANDGIQNGLTDTSPGRKYTKNGATIDMWHWKGVRMNPVGQIDDQYINDNTDPEVNSGWGRSGDSKISGGYSNNVQDGGPAFVQADLDQDAVVILDSKKIAMTESWSQTNRIPGIITSKIAGSRGDIASKGIWEDGVWTVEIQRSLITTGENSATQDVQFNDLSKAYDFGISIFDNSQINHVYHDGVIQLEF